MGTYPPSHSSEKERQKALKPPCKGRAAGDAGLKQVPKCTVGCAYTDTQRGGILAQRAQRLAAHPLQLKPTGTGEGRTWSTKTWGYDSAG